MSDLHAWIETVGVIVTALATIALARVTFVLAKETKRLADVGERPNVVITFEPNRRSMMYLDMIMQNVGTAPAYDVEFVFDPPLEIETQQGRTQPGMIKKISILKPQQLLVASFVSWADLRTKAFTTKVSWTRIPNSKKREDLSYFVDLQLLEGLRRLGGDPQVEMAQAVKKISDEVGHLGSGFRKLSVNTFSAADREKEQCEAEEWYEKNTKKESD
jgi:hypothetical protein